MALVKDGEEYRLLPEAEWEYVARAGTTTPFHTGATISTAQANYDGLSAPYGPGRQGPIPRPADRGRIAFAQCLRAVRYVHGNVAELVADCYDADSVSACTRRPRRLVGIPPRAGALRPIGSWCAPTLRNLHNGFRVARIVP